MSKAFEYRAAITKDGIDIDGTIYTSVSGAAHAVTSTQINGWRFWECKPQGQTRWILINEVFKKAHKRTSQPLSRIFFHLQASSSDRRGFCLKLK
jgi:hypothetical protein